MHPHDINQKLKSLMQLETEVPLYYPRDIGIWKRDNVTGKWSEVDDLPQLCVGDIETKKEKTKWIAVLGVFLDEKGTWYICNFSDDYPLPIKPFVLIGHNALDHDSKLLDFYYGGFVIDTMLLVRKLFGVPKERIKEYAKLKKNHAKGYNVPEWYHCVCESSLKASAKFLLGEDLKTSKRDGLAKYCAKDVYATLRIAQRLIPLALEEDMEIFQECHL